MQYINVLEAKSSLSRLVDAIAQGRKREIIIVCNDRPAACFIAITDHSRLSIVIC